MHRKSITRVIVFLIVVAFRMFSGAHIVYAETELEKFRSTMPPRAGLEFVKYNICVLTNYSDRKQAGLLFPKLREVVRTTCKKELDAIGAQLQKLGIGASDTIDIMSKYEALTFQEYALRYAGKPIPGYEISPENKALLACTNANGDNIDKYYACANRALEQLLPFSDEPSDVVADAVIGLCESVKSQMVKDASKCLKYETAQSVVETLVAKVRSSTLGKVAAFRAEAKRRQLPTTRPTPPPSAGQGI